MKDLNIVHAAALARIRDHGRARSGEQQGRLDVVNDGAVAIRSGRIAAVGRTDAVLASAGDDAPTIDASGKVVCPGLVECHSHPMFGGDRSWELALKVRGAGSAAVREAGGGITSCVAATRATADDVLLARAGRTYRRILQSGVTTLEVKSGYGQTIDQELRLLTLLRQTSAETPIDLVYTFLGAHIVPPEAESAESYARLVTEEMLPAVGRQGIAEFHDIVCESDVFEARIAAELLDASRAIGMPTRVHADASGPSDGWITAVAGGAIAADHLTYTPDDQIRSTRGTPTIAVLLPVAEQYYLDDRKANARLFIEQEVPVAIATDHCSAIHATSLLMATGLAATWYRMTPAEALVAATLNAAYALNRAHDRGSIDIGKRGDLLVLDCESADEIATAVGSPLIDSVISQGEIIASFGEETRP